MSKGFIETIEELWRVKDDTIDNLRDLLSNRERHIEILSEIVMKNENFKCIHDEGEQQMGHRYCDDRCPLVILSRFKSEGEIIVLPLNVMCKKPKNWSK